jgi:hypothetical protein
MQAEVQDAETDDGETEENGHANHQHVGIPRRGDEGRKIVRGGGVKLVSHRVPQSGQGVSPSDPRF